MWFGRGWPRRISFGPRSMTTLGLIRMLTALIPSCPASNYRLGGTHAIAKALSEHGAGTTVDGICEEVRESEIGELFRTRQDQGPRVPNVVNRQLQLPQAWQVRAGGDCHRTIIIPNAVIPR